MNPDRAVGIVGLGLVGSAVAARLRAAGFAVAGYDPRAEACDALVQAGGTPLANAAAVGAVARVVLIAVFDTVQLEQAVEGAQGLMRAQPRPTTLINLATADPERVAALAARLEAQDVALIEAPLSGSSAQIGAGESTMLLGGAPEAIAACEDVLAAITVTRLHVGAAGMGARAKLATNLVLGLNRAALAEGMVFAERLGIAPQKFLELVLHSPARSFAAETRGAQMASGDATPVSRIAQHLKDVELMLDYAREQHQRLPLSQAHAALMRAAVDAGEGELDNTAIVRQLRREQAT
ncbi:MAG TPA: NAD(P)-dependent oxidoreductase [Burkholderiales bacterium]|jgi:3-hydroxyisobutyrate dehydrogenase-like beta-hydroxyacid dehydrogenase